MIADWISERTGLIWLAAFVVTYSILTVVFGLL